LLHSSSGASKSPTPPCRDVVEGAFNSAANLAPAVQLRSALT
jgi:hypothetical protein